MKLIVFTALLFCSISLSAQNTLTLSEGQESPPAEIQDVAWISGHWKGEAFGGNIEEIWMPPSGNSMMFAFKLVVKDSIDFYEFVIIREHQNSLLLQLRHFEYDLAAWEEKDESIDFPLVKLEENKAYFDGFTFEQLSENELNVYVQFHYEDENSKEMKFQYQRYIP
jgi:hypothetical protein